MAIHDDGGAAFPGGLYAPPKAGANDRDPYNNGMSLRDWFAGQALAGMQASLVKQCDWLCSDTMLLMMARQAYDAADAMLKARKERNSSVDE